MRHSLLPHGLEIRKAIAAEFSHFAEKKSGLAEAPSMPEPYIGYGVQVFSDWPPDFILTGAFYPWLLPAFRWFRHSRRICVSRSAGPVQLGSPLERVLV
jgi:hypothetical protein